MTQQILESQLTEVNALNIDTDFIRCVSGGNSRIIKVKNLSSIIHEAIEIAASDSEVISFSDTAKRGILFICSADSDDCGIYTYNISNGTVICNSLVSSANTNIDITVPNPQTTPISITIANGNDSSAISCFILRHE